MYLSHRGDVRIALVPTAHYGLAEGCIGEDVLPKQVDVASWSDRTAVGNSAERCLRSLYPVGAERRAWPEDEIRNETIGHVCKM
jgi:hypothetical protein